MIPVSLPIDSEDPAVQKVLDLILPAMQEIIRRASDGTAGPLLVDYVNQRLLVGTTTATGDSATKMLVDGDIRVVGSASGIVLPCPNGTSFARIVVENPDSNGNIVIRVDPL